MPEVSDKERIAKLETSMIAVLLSIDRRTSFESEVLSKLAVISSKMDDYKDYQKTCEAERHAYGVRLADTENKQKTQTEVTRSNRNILILISTGAGSIAGLVVSILSLLTKH